MKRKDEKRGKGKLPRDLMLMMMMMMMMEMMMTMMMMKKKMMIMMKGYSVVSSFSLT